MNRSRLELKSFFKKGAIPTESQFADLIDNVLLQREDAVVKTGNDPLNLRAVGPEDAALLFSTSAASGDREAGRVRLRSGADRPGLLWTVPGNGRVFLDETTGNLGVGIDAPTARLHVDGVGKFGGSVQIEGEQTLELGYGIPKEANAGKLGYQVWTDGLDIVGAGTEEGSRKIQLFAEGGLSIRGPVAITPHLNEWPTVALEVYAQTTTTSHAWLEAIRFTNPDHSAITHPGGGLLFGLNSNRRFYFSDIQSGTPNHVAVIDVGNARLGIGNENPAATLDVRGIGLITGGSSDWSLNRLSSGALCLGSTENTYGGQVNTESKNLAALLLETSQNTEIAVHHSGRRIVSLMYYEGGSNQIRIGRDMGWGAISSVVFPIQNSVGVGTTDPKGRLQVHGGILSQSGHVANGTAAKQFLNTMPNSTWFAAPWLGALYLYFRNELGVTYFVELRGTVLNG